MLIKMCIYRAILYNSKRIFKILLLIIIVLNLFFIDEKQKFIKKWQNCNFATF